VLQKSQKALRLISRQRKKQATMADQCSLKPATGIAYEFGAWHFSTESFQFRQMPRRPKI
jgi:hypothetical protein